MIYQCEIFHDFWWFVKVPWLSVTFPENFIFPGFPDPVGLHRSMIIGGGHKSWYKTWNNKKKIDSVVKQYANKDHMALEWYPAFQNICEGFPKGWLCHMINQNLSKWFNITIYIVRNKTGKNPHMSNIQRRPEHDVLQDEFKKYHQKFKFSDFFSTGHITHFLKLFDKMCKYEMGPASIVEDTELAQFGLQTNGTTEGQMERQTERQSKTSIPPSTSLGMGIKIMSYKTFWGPVKPEFSTYLSVL